MFAQQFSGAPLAALTTAHMKCVKGAMRWMFSVLPENRGAAGCDLNRMDRALDRHDFCDPDLFYDAQCLECGCAAGCYRLIEWREPLRSSSTAAGSRWAMASS